MNHIVLNTQIGISVWACVNEMCKITFFLSHFCNSKAFIHFKPLDIMDIFKYDLDYLKKILSSWLMIDDYLVLQVKIMSIL